jgi:23S rRNA (cytosine1962-C5)-methyltransferase
MNLMQPPMIETILRAIRRRSYSLADHTGAFRLFNGFLEGVPELVIDVYAQTGVIFNYASPSQVFEHILPEIQDRLVYTFPWLKALILKERHALHQKKKTGVVVWGNHPDTSIVENGVHYAIDLLAFQDASLFLDTRNLRSWIKEHVAGKSVLNCFAYTGSLGVAALAGSAHLVTQLDRSANALKIAQQSCQLNRIPTNRSDYLVGDFFKHAARLRRESVLFDIVILDPPFYSTSPKGTVDMVQDSRRMINKIRPLVRDGGIMVVVNNALFLSGYDFMAELEALCAEGFLQIETTIPIPEDITGYNDTRRLNPPVDPAPFNYPTKIVILKVKRKDYK